MEQRALGQGEINNLIVSYLYWQNRLVFIVKKKNNWILYHIGGTVY